MRARFWIAQFLWFFVAFIAINLGNFNNTPYLSIFPLVAIFMMTGFLQNWGERDEDQTIQLNDEFVITLVIRIAKTMIGWGGYLGFLAAFFGNTWTPIYQLPFLALPLIALSLWIWGIIGLRSSLGNLSNSLGVKQKGGMSLQIKRKRERIDDILRDLSDDELLDLRDRLSDGAIDEDSLYERFVGNDGELVYTKS